MSNVAMTNYEMNKQAYLSEKYKFDPVKISQDLDYAAWIFYLEKCKYLGLLCRERNDYTVFKLSDNLENLKNELKEVLYSRGIVVDVIYTENDFGDTYQVWVKESRTKAIDYLEKETTYEWTPQVWMYMLFDATDWVVEVEN